MTTILLIIHLFVTLALIGVVLIQRSEGGGLGIGTSQGMGSFMSGRGTANLLTRTTAVLATIFMLLSLLLALLNRGTAGVGGSILDVPPPAPVTAPAAGSNLPIPGAAPIPGMAPGPAGAPLPGAVPPPSPAPTAPAAIVPPPSVPAPPPAAAAPPAVAPAPKPPSAPAD